MALGKKFGGRKKGTPNKFNQSVAELCAEKNCSPAEALIDFCMGEDSDKRFAAASKLMDYCYSRLTAITVTQNPQQFEAQSSFQRETIATFRNLVKVKYGDKK